MKEMRCGGRLSAESLARCRGVGVRGRLEKILGLGCVKKLGKIGGIPFDNAKFQIGDGNRVRFWKDLWCGEEALCRSFPTLFSLILQ